MAKAAKPNPPTDKQSGNTSGLGGYRPGSGRPRGAKNKKTLELEAKAKKYSNDALSALVAVAKTGESEAARVSAATAILDRAHGKPRQAVEYTGPNNGPIQVQVWKFGAREVTF